MTRNIPVLIGVAALGIAICGIFAYALWPAKIPSATVKMPLMHGGKIVDPAKAGLPFRMQCPDGYVAAMVVGDTSNTFRTRCARDIVDPVYAQ